MIDINYSLAQWSGNVNVIGYNWQSYGHALWYDTRTEDYSQAIERIKAIIWEKIYSDHPHLVGTEIRYTDFNNLPIIQEKDR